MSARNDSRSRSLFKALSWRLVALTVTAAVAYAATESAAFALSIGLADSLIKIFAYYFHERAWENVEFGRPAEADAELVTVEPVDAVQAS